MEDVWAARDSVKRRNKKQTRMQVFLMKSASLGMERRDRARRIIRWEKLSQERDGSSVILRRRLLSLKDPCNSPRSAWVLRPAKSAGLRTTEQIKKPRPTWARFSCFNKAQGRASGRRALTALLALFLRCFLGRFFRRFFLGCFLGGLLGCFLGGLFRRLFLGGLGGFLFRFGLATAAARRRWCKLWRGGRRGVRVAGCG